MRLSDIGEDALIERVVKEHLLPESGPGLIIGVGDDAAVLDLGQNELTIVTTDMLVEGTHFRLDWITPYQLGWKAAAANISDVGAMGGVPTWTFVAFGFKPHTEVEFVDELYHGITDCAAKFGSMVAGGDTNAVEAESVISVTQMGQVEQKRLALRSGARIGDRILVTGMLGNSRAGLELMMKLGFDEADRLHGWLVNSHLMPDPRISEARAAVETGAVKAMMDISDGLAADLPKLCKASKCGAVVYADKIPFSEELTAAAEELGFNPVELAASGGEDFELLIIAPSKDVDKVIMAVENVTETPVFEIGEIVEDAVEIAYPDGERETLKGGWKHFGVK